MNREDFKNPQRVAALDEAQVPLWFWNDVLTPEELARQLKLMTEAGIKCNSPHARTGFQGGYLDEAWMSHIQTVLAYKRENNEKAWLYDEFNWPAGSANGEVPKHEEFREKFLTLQEFHVPANTRFRRQPEQISNAASFSMENEVLSFGKKKHIDNIFLFDEETMEPLDITLYQPDDLSGVPYNMSEGDFELFRNRPTIVIEAKISTEMTMGEGILTPDYLNDEATKHFLDVTYEAYYKTFPDDFGTVITASFNDETRFCHAFPWTQKLQEEFKKRFGYDLIPHLPDLILPGEEAGRTRCLYFDLLAELYRKNYHKMIRDWCEAHHIDYAPHLLGEETMAGQVRFSGEYMRQTREVSRPCVDHLGRGIGSLNLRYAASAAELYGKKGLACETFAACGWELTYEEYRRMTLWLFSQGVKTLVNHGFFYSTEGIRAHDWPPSEFFQWQGWPRMGEANAMTRRLYGMLVDTTRLSDVLVYHPTETYWLHYLADQGFKHGYHMGALVKDETAMRIDRDEQILLNTMQQENRDFTMFCSDAADQFEVRDGKLVQKTTGQSFSVFVVPFCEVMPVESAKLLLDFTKAGGTVLFVQSVPHLGMMKQDDETVCQIMEEMLKEESVCVIEDFDVNAIIDRISEKAPMRLRILSGNGTCKKNKLHYPAWVIDPYMHTGENMTGISWSAWREEDETRYLIINYGDRKESIAVRCIASVIPQIWDPVTGEVWDADVTLADSQKFEVKVDVEPGCGLFLIAKE